MRYGLSLAAFLAALVVGCNKSPEGGATGTTNSFTVTGPTMTTSIKQDNSESVKLTLNRGKDFKQNVKLAAASPSDKVKAELNKSAVTPADPGEVVLKVSVAKDAPLGDNVIKVTATPEGGTATSVDVKVTVTAP